MKIPTSDLDLNRNIALIWKLLVFSICWLLIIEHNRFLNGRNYAPYVSAQFLTLFNDTNKPVNVIFGKRLIVSSEEIQEGIIIKRNIPDFGPIQVLVYFLKKKCDIFKWIPILFKKYDIQEYVAQRKGCSEIVILELVWHTSIGEGENYLAVCDQSRNIGHGEGNTPRTQDLLINQENLKMRFISSLNVQNFNVKKKYTSNIVLLMLNTRR